MTTYRHCQKCGKETPEHEQRECAGCKLRCCLDCLEALQHVGQANRCHECAAVQRSEEIRARLERSRRP